MDFVATRDLTALKVAIDEDKAAVESATDSMGFTPLHVACARGSIDICRALLGHEPTAEEATADSPKRMSKKSSGTKESMAVSGRRPMSEEVPVPVALPAAFCNVNARSVQGYTPLHIAAWRGHLNIVRLLLDSGADPAAMSEGFRLDSSGAQELADYYLARGGSGTPPPVPMRFPRTAYQFARLHRHIAIERLLLPLTLTPAAGFESTPLTQGGEEDSVVHYCTSINPLAAAAKCNLLFFSLALDDLLNGGLVHAERYRAGLSVLESIRTAIDSETGSNVLLKAVEGCRSAEGEQLLAMLLVPCFVERRPGFPFEDCVGSVFSVGPTHFYTEADYTNGRVLDTPLTGAHRGASPPTEIERPSTAPRSTEIPDLDATAPPTQDGPSVCTPNAITGLTALHLAVRASRVGLVRLLLAMDSDPSAEAKSVEGLTPRTAAGGTPSDMCAAADADIKAVLDEAIKRHAFMGVYAQRNFVPPSERADFSESAKELKRQWRRAAATLLGM